MNGSAKDSNPTATFVLYAYNEERYIREAIESAFSQTYSPLEIVLSDDGSQDRTFKIMQEMAAAYRGPHHIIMNRNPSNRGIGSQINVAWEKGTGELLVLANGDDISLPQRVERIVSAWQSTDMQAAAIASAYEIMEEDGTRTGRVVRAEQDFTDIPLSTYLRFGGPIAAVMCVSRRCFDRFGPLAPNLILEDGPMNLRSSLTGAWCFLEEPLVLYRVHAENISQAYQPSDFQTWRARHRSKAMWQMREGEKAFVQMLTDLYSAGVVEYDERMIAQARINAARRLLDYQLRASYYSGSWPYSLRQWLGFSFQLFQLALKTAIKTLFPLIERRNDRWHYRAVVRAAAGESRADSR